MSSEMIARLMRQPEQHKGPLFLGVECGGTKSVAILTQNNGGQAVQYEAGPGNIRLLNDIQLVKHFQKISLIHRSARKPDSIAIGMAGARAESDRKRIRDAAEKVWPGIPCYATNDLETALAAAKSPNGKEFTRVLLVSGTGSCCFGVTPDGKRVRVGGWGHLIGDKGSAYEIGLRALKAVVYYFDRDGEWPLLGQKLLRALQLNKPDDLIGWVQNAGKAEVAALAVTVFDAWLKKDKIAADILEGAASSLAKDGACCAARLVKKGQTVQFVLAGSILQKQPKFTEMVRRKLKELWPQAVVTPLQRDSVWGAVELAQKHAGLKAAPVEPVRVEKAGDVKHPVISADLPATERRNPLSINLDQLPFEEMVQLMLREDAKIPDAIYAEREKIARAIRLITNAFKKGGRLFYAGAGTSGRLGVLDASECPPTFRTPPEMVQGIIAGGQAALWRAVEGAEDDMGAGQEAIQFSHINHKDIVIGIAASGRTPFVWGALREAQRRKAVTMLICFNPHLKVAPKDRPRIIIAPDVGPEVLTGSTRLKAGTATKLILNMLTTLAMVRMGKVVSNLMVDLNPSNIKLKDRAVRIVCEITGAPSDKARTALEKSGWVVKTALKRLRRESNHRISIPASLERPVYRASSQSKSNSAIQL